MDNSGITKAIVDLGFQDVLSHLVTLYRRNILVPFIGSGMSLPACAKWLDFLKSLATEVGVKIPGSLQQAGKPVESSVLYRLADVTVSALRPLSYAERTAKYRKALRTWPLSERAEIPPQTISLARLYWPLVLSTNYDDLYWSATFPSARPVILGRRLEDCHRVLRSLDESTPPILWTLQGFLGGQAEEPENVVTDPRQRRELGNQVVVGHEQYQRVINSEGHFRRAFAEVFRRRSLLFIGSGLLEDYLVNLFGEIIHYHGPGPYPHFALLSGSEAERFDPWFLQNRLGIVPVFYKSHGDIPGLLDELASGLRWPGNTQSKVGAASTLVQPDELAFSILSSRGQERTDSIKVRLCNYELPLPRLEIGECSAASVGRWNDMPVEGKLLNIHFREAIKKELIGSYDKTKWVALDESPPYAFRYGDSALFAIAARRKNLKGKRHDRRDLGIIPDAVCTLLKKIDEAGFNTVHLGAVASGQQRPWHPIHPFAQTLRGIRKFTLEPECSSVKTINLYIVDPAVWYPVVGGKIPIAELLSSNLMTHRVELRDEDGNTELFALTSRESPSLDELLNHCRINSNSWRVELSPYPTDERERIEPRGEMTIAPTMTVILTPPGGKGGER